MTEVTKIHIAVEHPGSQTGFNFLGAVTGKAAKILAECASTDEPIFVLRGKDIFSVLGIAGYLDFLEKYSPDDHDLMAELVDQVAEFKQWQKNNMDKVRYPD